MISLTMEDKNIALSVRKCGVLSKWYKSNLSGLRTFIS